MSAQQEEGEFQFRQLAGDYRAFGMVMEFVAARSPFDAFPAKTLVAAIKHQITSGCHLCAFRGRALVGYCGWLPITNELGERWLARKAQLRPVPQGADAIALTIVCVDDPRALRGLVRAGRGLRPGQRIFFKRVGAAGSGRPPRRAAMAILPRRTDPEQIETS